MRIKSLAVASALTLIAANAFAQTGTTDPKGGVGAATPTKAQCDAGHSAGSKMSKMDFDAACAKVRERKEKTQ
jgi:hypothetical protein